MFIRHSESVLECLVACEILLHLRHTKVVIGQQLHFDRVCAYFPIQELDRFLSHGVSGLKVLFTELIHTLIVKVDCLV